MASIQKRPDGSWRARYRDESGREHARHFDRKVDGRRWLDEINASVITGQYVDPQAGRAKLRDYGESWRTAAAHGPTTRKLVERTLRLYIYPSLGDLPISAIRPSMVQATVTQLAAQVAPSTLRLAYSYLVAVFKAAVRDRVVATSPCDGVKLPRSTRLSKVEVPPLAVLDVLAANLPPRFRVVPALVAGTGLRQGELFGLEVGHLDFLRGRSVEVSQQLVTLSPGPAYLGPPKTAESARVVPLAQLTLYAVAAHLAQFPTREVEIEDRVDPRNPHPRRASLLFTTNAGMPVERHRWSAIWSPAARAAGLPPRTGLHALRHLYASLLIRHGESVKVVQRRLGHSSAVTTLGTYAHLWPDADDRTREAVETALRSPADSSRTGGASW
jgi:integrase